MELEKLRNQTIIKITMDEFWQSIHNELTLYILFAV